VEIGLETLDMVKLHDRALKDLLPPHSTSIAREDIIHRASIFFAEAIIPIERTHRTVLEANADLDQLNATLTQRTLALAESNRELEVRITERKVAVETLKSSEDRSALLVEEAGQLERHLQAIAHQIMAAHEAERKKMSLTLHDEISQTLLGIHVRLLALDKELSLSAEGFKKEIANTQRLVGRSVKTLNRFVRELGIVYES